MHIQNVIGELQTKISSSWKEREIMSSTWGFAFKDTCKVSGRRW